jgi:hypothetical protein
MKFDIKLLNDVVLDYDNPDKIYALARQYDKLEQGSGAHSFYLRAADMSPGKTFEEKWLQYKCMILSSMIYQRNENRNQSVQGLLKIAIATLPNRPEAYYFMAKLKRDQEDYREAIMYAQIGMQFEGQEYLDNDVGYPGDNALKVLYARCRWKTDGRDDSKNLAFDLKYKNKLNKKDEKAVNALLAEHGYPSTLAYDPSLFGQYKFKFDGQEDIKTNYSRHFQDMFVLSVLDGKRDGTFIEIGSGHPELFNNTLLLERDFGWRGINIDSSERFAHIFSRHRKTNMIHADAAGTDYGTVFKQQCLEQHIDFLRINCEYASIEALKNIPFAKHEFGIIQFQHNATWWGDQFRKESREILQKIGYILLVSDVAVDNTQNYEDWWVHPMHANRKQNMKSSNKINFAWDYMMENVK